MKTRLLKKAVRCLVAASLLASPCLSSISIAMPSSSTGSFIKTEGNNPVSVRNSTAKTDLSPASAKAQKGEDKKAISRCWKRLMTMVREVSHAHRKKTAAPQ